MKLFSVGRLEIIRPISSHRGSTDRKLSHAGPAVVSCGGVSCRGYVDSVPFAQEIYRSKLQL